jgi:hypothetical protein
MPMSKLQATLSITAAGDSIPSAAFGVALLAVSDGLLEAVRGSDRRTAPLERYCVKLLPGLPLHPGDSPFHYSADMEGEAADMLTELLASTDFVRACEHEMQKALVRLWRAYAQRFSAAVASGLSVVTSADTDVKVMYGEGALRVAVRFGD